MTTTISSPPAPTRPAERVTLRRALAAGAVVACLPYGVLKLLWLTGSHLGLRDHTLAQDAVMEVANLATFGMEVVAALLAVLLASGRRWRLPAWAVLPPAFVGTGLLGGILVLLPVELLMVATGALAVDDGGAQPAGPIAGWVYAVVYTGFAVLGLCLITLFALHVRERWLARGGWNSALRTWAPARPTAVRRAGVAALAVVLAGTAEATVAARTGWFGGHEVVGVLAALVAAGCAWSLARRRPAGRTGGAVLVLGVAAAAVVAAWGLYFFVLQVVPNPLRGSDPVPVALEVTEAARAVAAIALAAALVALGPVRRARLTA